VFCVCCLSIFVFFFSFFLFFFCGVSYFVIFRRDLLLYLRYLRPATPSRAWSRPWRSWASAGRRPTPPTCKHRRPRLRLEEGRRARPLVGGVCGGRLMESYFTRLVDYDFTASMGGRPRRDRVRLRAGRRLADRFYFGFRRRAGGRHRPGRWPQARRRRPAGRDRCARRSTRPALRRRRRAGRPLRPYLQRGWRRRCAASVPGRPGPRRADPGQGR